MKCSTFSKFTLLGILLFTSQFSFVQISGTIFRDFNANVTCIFKSFLSTTIDYKTYTLTTNFPIDFVLTLANLTDKNTFMLVMLLWLLIML